jgi:uncharacterized oxidoreductase
VLDMSLTQTSSSGVKLAARQGLTLEPGLILDEAGLPTCEARDYPASGFETHARQRARGSLAPLGNSHKGYALVLVVGLLTTLLPDTDAAWDVEDVAQGVPVDGRYGALLVAVAPDAFIPGGTAPRRVDRFIDAVKSSPRRDGVDGILYPGETSQRLRAEREQAGVCMMPAQQLEALEALGRTLGIPLAANAQPLAEPSLRGGTEIGR